MKEKKRKQISEERKKQLDAIRDKVETRSDSNWRQLEERRKKIEEGNKKPQPNMIVPFAKEESPSKV